VKAALAVVAFGLILLLLLVFLLLGARLGTADGHGLVGVGKSTPILAGRHARALPERSCEIGLGGKIQADCDVEQRLVLSN
jgi:hypothetical protein